jgi:hypothetical protein
MMGQAQGALFYEFSIDDHVSQDHLLRSIDRFVDLSDLRQYLVEFYWQTGRPTSTQNSSSACCWWDIVLVSAQSAAFARRCI